MSEIEKGIPIPSKRKGSGISQKMLELEINGSRCFMETDYKMHSVRQSASNLWKLKKMRFTCRSIEGGLRVWRIE